MTLSLVLAKDVFISYTSEPSNQCRDTEDSILTYVKLLFEPYTHPDGPIRCSHAAPHLINYNRIPWIALEAVRAFPYKPTTSTTDTFWHLKGFTASTGLEFGIRDSVYQLFPPSFDFGLLDAVSSVLPSRTISIEIPLPIFITTPFNYY